MSAKNRVERVVLLAVALVVRLATAVLIRRPGYMDTAYYATGAVRLAHGSGFSEPFIWNYLGNPRGIPHPGFLYWMPLPSLLAAPFAALFPGSFFAVQLPFALLSAAVPLLTYGLAWRASGQRGLARAAALLTLFSGFFFPYWTLPETFAPFALFGSLSLWVAGGPALEARRRTAQTIRSLAAGVLVGLAHLTRADGVLLLPMVALAPLTWSRLAHTRGDGRGPRAASAVQERRSVLKLGAHHVLIVAVGYGLVMGPWFARNLAVAGTPLPPAGTKTIWLTEYDDLFCYDCDLSLSSYLAWRWGNILRSKLTALWVNFQRFLAEDCLVFLLPFVAIGFYRLRRRLPFDLALLYLVGIYTAHSLVFTFPGWRGGFFHASSAALPFLHAAAMVGIDAATKWAAKRRRGWRYQQARVVFSGAVVVGALALSAYIAWQRVPAWQKADVLYEDVERWLTDRDAAEARVMVNNPPAFWYYTQRPAAVLPNGDVETLLEVADRYEMEYVLLEEDHPAKLENLHAGTVRHPRLGFLKSWSKGRGVLYMVQP